MWTALEAPRCHPGLSEYRYQTPTRSRCHRPGTRPMSPNPFLREVRAAVWILTLGLAKTSQVCPAQFGVSTARRLSNCLEYVTCNGRPPSAPLTVPHNGWAPNSSGAVITSAFRTALQLGFRPGCHRSIREVSINPILRLSPGRPFGIINLKRLSTCVSLASAGFSATRGIELSRLWSPEKDQSRVQPRLVLFEKRRSDPIGLTPCRTDWYAWVAGVIDNNYA